MDDILLKIRTNRPVQIAFLEELVSADSTNIEHGIRGNERNVQNVIIKKLRELGMELDIFEPDNEKLKKYKEMNPNHIYNDRPNVVGILKGRGKGRSLILNGHSDTMPFDKIDQWRTHPLMPKIFDEKLYGRGAVDMKGGIASFIMAIESILQSGFELKGDIIIQAVVDEEGGGNGTLACCDRGYKADAAIITEPTNLEIMPAHMGWLFYKVHFFGKALHGAMKWKGVNAIDKAVDFIIRLRELERNWAISKRHASLPPPTINVGVIQGGMAGSTVPDNCLVDFGVHYLPTDSDSEGLGSNVDKEIRDLIQRFIASDAQVEVQKPDVSLYQMGSAYDIGVNHPIIHVLAKHTQEFLQSQPVIRGCEYGSDARLLTNYAKTPTVLFGPGSIAQAHGINEYIDVEQYYKSIEILAATIMEWCG